MTQERQTISPANDLAQKQQVYAQVVVEDGVPGFRVTDPRLLKIYPVPESSDDKRACSLNWINTRNRFSAHVADKLLQSQRDYWRSGREGDLRPLSMQQFLALYPLRYLDASRLSRLVARLWVLTPRQELIPLKRLFPSHKRVAALRIKELVEQSACCLKDGEVQSALALWDKTSSSPQSTSGAYPTGLARQGIQLSRRTICNCRKLLNIPNHKERRNGYYGKDAAFGQSQRLAGKKFSRLPDEPGVYELSLPWKLDYPKGRSEVIYLGCTRDLRKRIASYSGHGLKNRRLKEFLRQGQVLVRFCRAAHYRALERQLLSNFRNHHGTLPKTNTMGA